MKTNCNKISRSAVWIGQASANSLTLLVSSGLSPYIAGRSLVGGDRIESCPGK